MTIQPDPKEVRKKFLDLGMIGMVALIDHVVAMEKAGRSLITIGSSTIDLHGLLDAKNMSEKERFETVWFRLHTLHFGGRGRTPLQDIDSSFEVLTRAPPEARARIDGVVGEFVRTGQAAETFLERKVRFVGDTPVPVDDAEGVHPIKKPH